MEGQHSEKKFNCDNCMIRTYMALILFQMDKLIDEIPLPALKVFVHLVSQSTESCVYWAPVKTVAAAANVKVSRLKKYLRPLRTRGWLEYEITYKEHNGRQRRGFQFYFPLLHDLVEDLDKQSQNQEKESIVTEDKLQ